MEGAARGNLMQIGGDEKGGLLDHAFTHELAFPLLGEHASG
jgi:hypothetical protein